MFVSLPLLALSLGVLVVALYLGLKPRSQAAQEELEQRLRRSKHEAEQYQKERDALCEDATKKREELQTIQEVARALGASTHLGETTQIVLSMVRRSRIPYQSCVIFLVAEGGGLEVGVSDPEHPVPRRQPHGDALFPR